MPEITLWFLMFISNNGEVTFFERDFKSESACAITKRHTESALARTTRAHCFPATVNKKEGEK